MINVPPITDELAARAAFVYRNVGGYIDNVGTDARLPLLTELADRPRMSHIRGRLSVVRIDTALLFNQITTCAEPLNPRGWLPSFFPQPSL